MTKKTKLIGLLLSGTLITVSTIPTSIILVSCNNGNNKQNHITNINVASFDLYHALNNKFTKEEWKTQSKLLNAANQVLDRAAGANKDRINCSFSVKPLIPTSDTSNNGTIKLLVVVEDGFAINIDNGNNVSFDSSSNIITIRKLSLKKSSTSNNIIVNPSKLYNALNLQFDDNDWKTKTKLTNAINKVLDDAAGADKNKVSCSLFGNPTIPSSDTSNNGIIKFKISVEEGFAINIDSNNNVLFDSNSNIVTISKLNLKKLNIVTINVNPTILYNALNAQFTLDQWNTRNDLSNAANQVLDDAAGVNKDKVSCYIYGNPSNPSNDGLNNGSIKFKINVGEGYAIHIDNTNNVSFDPNSNIITINGLSIKKPNNVCIVVKSKDLFDALNNKFTAKEWHEKTKLIDAINQVLDDAAGPNNKDKISCSIEGNPVVPTGGFTYNGSIKLKINVNENYTVKIDNTLFDTKDSVITINELNLIFYVITDDVGNKIDYILNDLAASINTRETNEELFNNHQNIVYRINSELATISPNLKVRGLEIYGGWENQIKNGSTVSVKFGILFNQPNGDMIVNKAGYFGYNVNQETLISNNYYITRYNGNY